MRTLGTIGEGCDRSTPRLTSRQLAILAYLAEGRGVMDIARELGYSPSTITKEVHLTIRGCGARSRAHAVAVGIRCGII